MQDLFVRYWGTCLLALLCWKATAQVGDGKNHVPVVNIDRPTAMETVKRNALVPYTIQVVDQEDGNSAYEEIAEREVLLLAKYLEDSSLLDAYLAKIDRDLSPLLAMSQSTCLNCHRATTRLIGPSFDLIAEKYPSDDKAKAELVDKVIKGSSGNWGEEKMPPHPDIDRDEAGLIIDWILTQKDQPIQFFIGLEGAIRIQKKTNDSNQGVYVLTAAYQDHGSTAYPEKRNVGLHSIVLRIRD